MRITGDRAVNAYLRLFGCSTDADEDMVELLQFEFAELDLTTEQVYLTSRGDAVLEWASRIRGGPSSSETAL